MKKKAAEAQIVINYIAKKRVRSLILFPFSIIKFKNNLNNYNTS